jgi:hypothetical protein
MPFYYGTSEEERIRAGEEVPYRSITTVKKVFKNPILQKVKGFMVYFARIVMEIKEMVMD